MASFTTNPIRLDDLLRDCEHGTIKLPDFQRSWVWDEERIRSLIASISLAFPVGALMTLETGGDVEFKARPVQGALDDAEAHNARYLLLDGQQPLDLSLPDMHAAPYTGNGYGAPQESEALVLSRHRSGA